MKTFEKGGDGLVLLTGSLFAVSADLLYIRASLTVHPLHVTRIIPCHSYGTKAESCGGAQAKSSGPAEYVVYKAIQKATNRDVAIKMLREGPFASATEAARFDREIQVLGHLRPPNIVGAHFSR